MSINTYSVNNILKDYIIRILIDVRGDNEYPSDEVIRANASLLETKFSQTIKNVIAETRKEDIEKWNKAMEILYCEHCGKLMSQDLVDKNKLELVEK